MRLNTTTYNTSKLALQRQRLCKAHGVCLTQRKICLSASLQLKGPEVVGTALGAGYLAEQATYGARRSV